MDSPTRKCRLAILGSTGSIGQQALQVVEEARELFDVKILAAGTRYDDLLQQSQSFPSANAILVNPKNSEATTGSRILTGSAALHDALESEQIDLVLNGITGFAGLEYSLKSLQTGCDLALANKESLVTAGALLKSVATASNCRIIPVDSEHNAILQCLSNQPDNTVNRITLTASGGPFRGCKRDELSTVTPEQALNHPTWKMGRRISVDSATLFNKAFEVIEAVELFGTPPGGIDVVVHPQSVVHAFVEFIDGNCLAHLSEPDMKVPIRHALHREQRYSGNFTPLDLVSRGELTFEPIDHEVFPALRLAEEVLKRPGSTLGAVFNAADEVVVDCFLSGDAGFLTIYDVVARALQEHEPTAADSLEAILEADLETRKRVRSWIP